MKTLLNVKSAVEVLAGLALASVPSMASSFLLGSPLGVPVGIILCRIGGAGLGALGIACWMARNDTQSRAVTGLIAATLVYDVAVVVVLLFARFAAGLSGIGLWPGVALHSALGIWCLACLNRGSRWRLPG